MDASEKYIRATDPHIYFELALLRLCNQEHAASQKIEYTPIKEEPVKPVEVKKVEVKEEPIEEIMEEPVFEPIEEEIIEEEPVADSEVSEPKAEEPAKQISFEDLLVHDYKELDFVKVEDVPAEVEKANETIFEAIIPGIPHPDEIKSGIKLFPESPNLRKIRSMIKATRAIYPQSSKIAKKKNKTNICGTKPMTAPTPPIIPSTINPCNQSAH